MSKLIYPFVLALVALVIAINGYSRDGFWYGAGAMFFVWWFRNAWETRNSNFREERLIAAYAPELVGKDFVAASAYVLAAIDRFNAVATTSYRKAFVIELDKEHELWRRQGKEVTPWATLSVLRRVETQRQITDDEATA